MNCTTSGLSVLLTTWGILALTEWCFMSSVVWMPMSRAASVCQVPAVWAHLPMLPPAHAQAVRCGAVRCGEALADLRFILTFPLADHPASCLEGVRIKALLPVTPPITSRGRAKRAKVHKKPTSKYTVARIATAMATNTNTVPRSILPRFTGVVQGREAARQRQ